MKVRASIVIPLRWQRDEWFKECVISALNQTVRCEVILVSPKTPLRNLRILQELKHGRENLLTLEEGPRRGFVTAKVQVILGAQLCS